MNEKRTKQKAFLQEEIQRSVRAIKLLEIRQQQLLTELEALDEQADKLSDQLEFLNSVYQTIGNCSDDTINDYLSKLKERLRCTT